MIRAGTSRTVPYRLHSSNWGGFRQYWSFISRLLLGCRPTTIPRLIVPVIIDAVDTISRPWPWPHIFQKIAEGRKPSFTKPDPSAAVIDVGGRVRIQAALPDVLPGTVLRGPAQDGNATTRPFVMHVARTPSSSRGSSNFRWSKW